MTESIITSVSPEEALEQAKKEHELLELYRMLINLEEEYNTTDKLLKKQKLLDDLRNIREEINQLEEEVYQRIAYEK